MNKISTKVLGVVAGLAGVLALAVPSFAQVTPYQVSATDSTAISTMATNSTASFLSIFETNWPTIATFAIAILAFFFIWRILVGFFSGRHHR